MEFLKIEKDGLENVIDQNIEYTFIESVQLTRGLKLFRYKDGEAEEVEINKEVGKYIQCVMYGNDWYYHDPHSISATIDMDYVYFEAHNKRAANERIKKSKKGLIELYNLKKPSKKTINIFEL